jgi:hypothetical protein
MPARDDKRSDEANRLRLLMLNKSVWKDRALREHPERVQIGLENSLLLLALVDVLLA